MTRSLVGWVFRWAALVLLEVPCCVQAQGDFTVLHTGSGETILTHSLDLRLPDSERQPALAFELGFATDEILLPDSFFDSFSVTLQPADVSKTALLLTIDTTGLARAPTNPGGLTLSPEGLDLQQVAFPDLSPTLDLQSAFTVSFRLPTELTDTSATLYFDLFDNQNSVASLAYVRNVQLNALPPTGQPTNIQVWSARHVDGPYTRQTSIDLDPDGQTLHFVPGGPQTFFLLQSPIRARILELDADSADWILTYTFDPVTLHLESAKQLTGPYTAEATATIDVIRQTLRLPAPDVTRFYRVRSEAEITLSVPRWEVGSLWFDYALPPMPVALLSSTTPIGPYLPEPAARQDMATRTLRLQRGGSIHFFQLTADRALRIRTLSRENGQVALTFDEP